MTDKELLTAAIEHFGSLEKVGNEIGVSKTTISLILNGKYENPKRPYEKLRTKLGYLEEARVKCPALKFEIHAKVCKRYAEAVRDGKVVSGTNFQIARETCEYCPINPTTRDKDATKNQKTSN
ncbi:MAG: hypothetical protein PHE67_12065 [Campylobacterales bacterium]|nr:hypothetical protein [Campylobacterales bacterium]